MCSSVFCQIVFTSSFCTNYGTRRAVAVSMEGGAPITCDGTRG